MHKLIITHDRPPVPTRAYDYCVHLDDDPERGVIGHGETPTEAVICAIENLPDLFHEEDWTVTVVQPRRASGARRAA